MIGTRQLIIAVGKAEEPLLPMLVALGKEPIFTIVFQGNS
jgi:hypothetical protein